MSNFLLGAVVGGLVTFLFQIFLQLFKEEGEKERDDRQRSQDYDEKDRENWNALIKPTKQVIYDWLQSPDYKVPAKIPYAELRSLIASEQKQDFEHTHSKYIAAVEEAESLSKVKLSEEDAMGPIGYDRIDAMVNAEESASEYLIHILILLAYRERQPHTPA